MAHLRDAAQSGGNVISLAAVRAARAAAAAPALPAAAPPACPKRGRDTVFFITSGRFEAMINGIEGVLRAGDFLRVPEGATYALRDIGETPGALVKHRFAVRPEPGLLAEIAAALPPYAQALPRRGTALHRRLMAIARRWGIALDSDEAA